LRRIVGNSHQCVADIVGRFNGRVGARVGNKVFAYFGYPAAHEDDAEQAVRAGLALCAAVSNVGPKAGVVLRCRAGIATGLVIAGDQLDPGEAADRGIVGEALSVADRLQALGQPSTVTVEGTTRHLIGNLFECRDLATTTDATRESERDQIWQVLGPGMVESRFEALHPTMLGPLLGREEELALLQRRWTQAANGEGSIVLICGEPGIGKSRIAQALEEYVRSGPHVRLRYFCSPHHTNSALYPIISQLEHAARFEAEDTPEQRVAKLEGLIAPYAANKDRAVALLAGLLSLPNAAPMPELSPQERKELTFAVLLSQLAGLTADQPTLMIFEDIHWLDPTSLELLTLTVERAPSLPLLLVMTFRPEFTAPWAGLPHITMMLLSRLGMRQRALLIEHIAGDKTLPRRIVEEIATRTDGVPLFVEELTRAILESGAGGDELEEIMTKVPSTALAIPPTLHASLMARLDRVGPAKEIAQIGAAIGREFSYELLAAVSPHNENDLRSGLDRLTSAGLLLSRGTPPQATYQFRHALVQDAAYGMLLKGRRQQLHASIGVALAEKSPSLERSQPEILAHHYTEAGLLEKAIEYWFKAGRLASARSAYLEAIELLRRGLELIESSKLLQSREVDFQLALGPAFIAARGYASKNAEVAFLRARNLLEGTGDIVGLEQAMHGLMMVAYNRAEFDSSLRFSQEELRTAEKRDDSSALCAAHKNMAATFHSMGRFEEGLQHAEKAVELFHGELLQEKASQYAHDFTVAALGYYGLLSWHRGLLAASADAAQRALTAAEWSGHTNTGAYGRHYAGALRAAVLDDKSMLETRALALLTYAQEHRLPQWIAWATCYWGLSLVHRGKGAEAVDKVREGVRRCDEIGNKAFRPLFLGFLAAADAASDSVNDAIETLDEAIAVGEATAERWYSAELWRQKGALCARLRDKNAATECFNRAMATARDQGSRPFELRAATSLSRLMMEEGRRQDVNNLLMPIYSSFVEGFDTPDLKEASALLEQLG
jgi:predicted ATPase